MRNGTKILIGIVLAAILLYAASLFMKVTRRVDLAENELQELRTASVALQRENESLRFDIDHAEDEETIAGIARDRLGLVQSDDRIYVAGQEP